MKIDKHRFKTMINDKMSWKNICLVNEILMECELKEEDNKNIPHECVVKPTLAGNVEIIYGHDRFANMTKPKFIRDRSGMLFEFKDITKYDGQTDRYVKELEQQQILAKYLLEQLSKCSL